MVLARLAGIRRNGWTRCSSESGSVTRGLDPFRTYSLGMRQRLGIAAAVLPDPELPVLDEPTNGLDPHGIAEIRSMLRSFADDGGITVFVSSHLLAEIQQICEHLVVIDAGRLIFQGGVDELLRCARPRADRPNRESGIRGRLLYLVKRTGRSGHMVGDLASTTLEIAADCRWAGDLNRSRRPTPSRSCIWPSRHSTLEEAFFEITRSCPQQGPREIDPRFFHGGSRGAQDRKKGAGRT